MVWNPTPPGLSGVAPGVIERLAGGLGFGLLGGAPGVIERLADGLGFGLPGGAPRLERGQGLPGGAPGLTVGKGCQVASGQDREACRWSGLRPTWWSSRRGSRRGRGQCLPSGQRGKIEGFADGLGLA